MKTVLPKVARRAALIGTSWALAWTPLSVMAQPAPPSVVVGTLVADQMDAGKLIVDDLSVGRLVVQQPVAIAIHPEPPPGSFRWPWQEETYFEAARPAFPRKEFMGASVDEMTVGAALLFCQDPTQGLIAPALPQRLFDLRDDKLRCSMAVINQVGLDYAHRADSRQKQSDWAAAIAVVSTAALVIGDGKMVTHTRDLWAIGALLPILQDDIRAVTPRAMLYRSASNSMFLVSNKYVDLGQTLGKFATAQLPDAQRLNTACTLLEDWSREIKTVKAELPGELVLENLTPRLELCRDQQRALNQFRLLQRRWLDCEPAPCVVDRDRLGALASRNAGQLVRHVAGIDAVMKADPFTAVRTAAAAPFQKAADIIGGTVKGRNDPLDGKQYELALVSGLAPGDIPGALGMSARPEGSVQTALDTLSTQKDSKKKNAKSTRAGFAAIAMTNGPAGDTLVAISTYLNENSDMLNTARDLALAVQQVDRQLDLNLDPRKAALDPAAVAAAAEAKKNAEAEAAAKAAGEQPKPEEPAKEEPATPGEPVAG